MDRIGFVFVVVLSTWSVDMVVVVVVVVVVVLVVPESLLLLLLAKVWCLAISTAW